jgi:menaquinone-dependent protoporphyrinogen oxidase
MSTVAIVYATREGHSRKIADHLAARLRARGHVTDVVNARSTPHGFDLGRHDAAIVAASIHAGKHEPEMIEFVRKRRLALAGIPVAFLSVSLTETTAEDTHATLEARAKASADVKEMLERFFRETGYRPTHVKPIAGALLYTQYGVLKRFLMKFIAGKGGGPTDTSRDYEFTDWQALDRFADAFADELPKTFPVESAPAAALEH